MIRARILLISVLIVGGTACGDVDLGEELSDVGDRAIDAGERRLPVVAGEALRGFIVFDIDQTNNPGLASDARYVENLATKIPGDVRISITDIDQDGVIDGGTVTVWVGERAACVTLPNSAADGETSMGACGE